MRLFYLTLLLFSLALPGPGLASEPDYQLKDFDGKLHSVSDHRGKWLVINFWASWCPPCIKEMPEFEKFYQSYPDKAHVWGVTFENSGKDAILAFVDRIGVSYPILGYGQDPLTGYASVNGLPTTFIIDPKGLFYHRFQGPVTAQQIANIIPDL